MMFVWGVLFGVASSVVAFLLLPDDDTPADDWPD